MQDSLGGNAKVSECHVSPKSRKIHTETDVKAARANPTLH